MTATKYAYEYGKRWDARTPRMDLASIVDNLHAGESDLEVTSKIEERLTKAGPEFTPRIKYECVVYAIERHARNRALYRHVMRGAI